MEHLLDGSDAFAIKNFNIACKTFTMPTGAASGSVLTSDSKGAATWQAPAASGFPAKTTIPTTFSGIWALDQKSNVYVTKSGTVVVCSLPLVFAAANTPALVQFNIALPNTSYLPSPSIYNGLLQFIMAVGDNGQALTGMLQLNPTESPTVACTLQVLTASGAAGFSGASIGGSSGVLATSFQWMTDS